MTLSTESINIVVADDNDGIRTGVPADIHKSFPGAVVKTFGDAVSTQMYLAANPYETDILFLDVDFGPGASGLDVLEDIRDSDGILPIVLLTATTGWADLATACRLYDVQFIEKPVGAGPLCVHIESALGRRERLRELRGNIDDLQESFKEAAKSKPDASASHEVADSDLLRAWFPRLTFSKAAVAQMLACNDLRLVKALADLNGRTMGNGGYLKQIQGKPGLWECRFSLSGRVFLRFEKNRAFIEEIDPHHRVFA